MSGKEEDEHIELLEDGINELAIGNYGSTSEVVQLEGQDDDESQDEFDGDRGKIHRFVIFFILL